MRVVCAVLMPNIENSLQLQFKTNLMVANFCHHLIDNYVDMSDLYFDMLVIYVDLSDHYVDMSEKYHHN
mgnify:CR=1 FL=1